jgi:predicted nucleic acid-binding protein
MQIFIDTNIFLDLILKREKYKEALYIFNGIEQGLFDAYILDITILNIDYIAKKQTQDIREFLNVVNKLFNIVGASNTSIEKALRIDNNDLEDNLQYISAKSSKCKIIITNDKTFYKKDIKIMSSEEFASEFKLPLQ